MPSSSIDVMPADTLSAGSGHFYPLTVRSIHPETRDAVTIVFDVPPYLAEKFRFIQGQYVTLRADINGEEVRRSYSICSAVQDGFLRVGIKRAPGGLFSNWIAGHVKCGCVLEVMPPEGRFHVKLSPEHSKNYVAFAAGSGITPVLSIIKTTLLEEPKSEFTLFYGNRASSTIMFREELAELKDIFLGRLSLIHVLSREHQDADLLNGRITGEKAALLVKQFCRSEEIDTVFLCGPQQMAEDVSAKLRELAIPASRIRIELFSASNSERQSQSTSPAHGVEQQSQITIVYDGAQYLFTMPRDSETILNAALRRGIDLRHSCKSGVCATCRAKVVDGEVDMDANYALEDYEIARGFVLTCQSYPVTEQVTVDFDQDN
ncbi:MAG: phenylacetate-CoA oxygenase/reductase subunit PaaK [Acidobacteriaceae bacterium]|nr:phenylacetate-CoA oxygenase/reductase subunit PaaK [Acidobacteriaceae bacterium]